MTASAMSYWSSVELPWQRCLGLAWEAYGAGSVPVGSVLTETDGMIVAEGRNRAFDTTAPDGELAGAYVAHAEINVLASLPPGDYPDHTLWSSLEPCFLCSAAILHSHVGNVRFARTDPVMSGVYQTPTVAVVAGCPPLLGNGAALPHPSTLTVRRSSGYPARWG